MFRFRPQFAQTFRAPKGDRIATPQHPTTPATHAARRPPACGVARTAGRHAETPKSASSQVSGYLRNFHQFFIFFDFDPSVSEPSAHPMVTQQPPTNISPCPQHVPRAARLRAALRALMAGMPKRENRFSARFPVTLENLTKFSKFSISTPVCPNLPRT